MLISFQLKRKIVYTNLENKGKIFSADVFLSWRVSSNAIVEILIEFRIKMATIDKIPQGTKCIDIKGFLLLISFINVVLATIFLYIWIFTLIWLQK